MKDQLFISHAPPAWSLSRAARALLKGLRRGRWVKPDDCLHLSISCVDRSEMTQLNAHFRGKRQSTDVLSFEQNGKGPKGVVFLGDIVLCREIVRSQAREQGHRVRDEATVLLAHGLLHLLGYDHERSTREASRMALAEKRLLRLAGYSRLRAGLIERVKIKRAHVTKSKRR